MADFRKSATPLENIKAQWNIQDAGVNCRDTYLQRQSIFENLQRHHARVDARMGPIRLAAAALIVVTLVLCASAPDVSWYWLLPAIGAFAAIVVYHSSVRRALARAGRALEFYAQRLARIDDRWIGTGSGGERFDPPHHVYAADFDLFGRGSLFELLAAVRTRMGEEQLARWLLSPAAADTIRARQSCVEDLRHRVELREDLALAGPSARVGVRPDALLAWAAGANELEGASLRILAWLLPPAAVAGVVVMAVWGLHAPLLIVLVLEGLLLYSRRDSIRRVILGTEDAFDDLALLAGLLSRIEREHFDAAKLQELVNGLRSHALPASATIVRLGTVAGFVEARRNVIVALLQVPLLYSLHTALAAERWRKAHGAAVRAWLEALGEFEALLSIAAYACEHPEDPFPQIEDGPACFDGEMLGHPLMPRAQCVRNDVSLCGSTRVLLVSGSNMSGKSTLLRTAGINAVLAMAGAPVRAARLRLTPLQVGASIRVNDSLHEGSSRFYAEITRLKQLVALMEGPLPLFFLLDELLQGTNSKDRRMGAEGMLRAFMERGAIGLVSTHDLALTDFEMPGRGTLRNVHFEDAIVDGTMSFDFRLRDGVVTRSNGVELMRSIGLKV